MAGNYDFTMQVLPPLLTGIVLFALAITVASRQRRTPVARMFGAALVAVAAWLFSLAAMLASDSRLLAEKWAHVALFFVPLIPVALYHFTVAALRKTESRRPLLFVFWGGAFLMSVLALFGDGVIGGMVEWSWGFYPISGRLAPAFLAVFFVPFVGSFLELGLERRRSLVPNRRNKIDDMLISYAIVLPAAVDLIPLSGVGTYPAGFVFLLLFLVHARSSIVRHRLVATGHSVVTREIVDTMADALLVCDADGKILVVNHAVASIFGYAEDEVVGRSIDTFVNDSDATLVNADRLRRALGQGTLRDLEKSFRAKSGETVDVSISISPLTRGKLHVGSVIAVRDIRERKQAEREIKHTASLLQSTLESTADGILVIARDGSIVSYNGRFATMWRVPHEFLDTRHDEQALEWMRDQVTDRENFSVTLQRLAARAEAESFDTVELRDGRVFERHSIPQQLDGATIGRVWSFRDITERRRAESALRASEKRYRTLFERNLAGVYRTALDGTILDCNEAFARIFGYESREELIGNNARTLFFDDGERDAVIDLLRKVRNISSLELCLKRRDGSRVWCLENVNLVEEHGEEPAIMEGTLVDISGLKIAEEQMEFQAYHDVLTCLPNRKLFIDRLSLALAQAKRTGTSLAVMFLDIDHFKIVNDTLGHTTGDELLLCVAERLSRTIREGDTVARIGGDEFTILISSLHDPDDAAKIAEQILEAIEEPVYLAPRQLYVTASIGIALWPNDGVDAETLLKNADSALYRAKDLGRNNYQLCTDEMKVRALERLSLEANLRRALEKGELLLHYQPVVNLNSGRITGMEALIRWNHPERGLTFPDAFIPLAESSRLIIPIGDWVLRTACLQAAQWRDAGFDSFRMAVNLSARQFQQRDLAQSVESVLREIGLSPDLLELEITESTAMQNADLTVETLHLLREMGVAISIDDFGTGYSSLNYLKRFPISTVKIDKSFVRDLNTDESDSAIVSAVIGIARILNLRVIAEGVETEEQFSILQRKQCEEMQGFYFAAPMDAAAMTTLLRAQGRLFSPVPPAMTN